MNAPLIALNVPHSHKLTVEEFIILDNNGMFESFSKSELIDGEIVCLNAQFSRHAQVKSLLLTDLNIALRTLASDLQAWAEVSVHLSDHSLPEPDIVVTRFRGTGAVPHASVALLVEVADTTLQNDMGRKAALYAMAGIPEYWVADVEGRVIHQTWGPSGEAYAKRRTVAFGAEIAAATLTGVSVETGRLG